MNGQPALPKEKEKNLNSISITKKEEQIIRYPKRKFKPDDLRKKIKARFHKTLKNLINQNLKAAGSQYFLDYLPQSFVSNISRQFNSSIMDKTLKEILMTDFSEIKSNTVNFQNSEESFKNDNNDKENIEKKDIIINLKKSVQAYSNPQPNSLKKEDTSSLDTSFNKKSSINIQSSLKQNYNVSSSNNFSNNSSLSNSNKYIQSTLVSKSPTPASCFISKRASIDRSKYLHNLKVLTYLKKHPEIEEKSGFDTMSKMTYKELLTQYFSSKLFKKSLERLKEEGETENYIKLYKEKSEKYVEFFTLYEKKREGNK